MFIAQVAVTPCSESIYRAAVNTTTHLLQEWHG